MQGLKVALLNSHLQQKVDPEKFIKLIQQNPIVYRFDGPIKI